MRDMNFGKKRKTTKTPVGVFKADIKTNAVLQRFSSAEVAKNITGIHVSSINACIRGERKSAGGFRWLKESKNK